MRVVRTLDTLADGFERAKSEALQSFGNGTVFLERFLEQARHIEVQLLADSQVHSNREFIKVVQHRSPV